MRENEMDIASEFLEMASRLVYIKSAMLLPKYEDEAEDLKKDVQKAGKTVKQQIESTAPKKTGKYSKSWAVKKTRETSDSIQIVVHSKRYQLTHLLEFGHAKRGGGRTRAFPHIAPAEQAGIEQLTRDIERDLQKGG